MVPFLVGTATVEPSRALVAVREVRGSNPTLGKSFSWKSIPRQNGWMDVRARMRVLARIAKIQD